MSFCRLFSKSPIENTNNSSQQFNKGTPLIGAIEKGFTECFNVLVNTPGIDLNCRDPLKRTPLIVAIHGRRYEMAFKLIEKHVDINASDVRGYTPIAWAIILSCSTGLIKALIEAKANLDWKDEYKRNFWHLAMSKPHFDEICPLLISGGIHNLINEEDAKGDRPLITAFKNCNSRAFKTLLQYGGEL